MTSNHHGIASFVACVLLLTLLGCSAKTDSKTAPEAGTTVSPFDPTAPRTPTASKSLTLASSWQAPSPTRTQPAKMKSRVSLGATYGVPTRTVGVQPSDAELGALALFPESLRPTPGESSTEETQALASALREDSHDDRGIDALLRFLDAYPASRWAPVLHLNIGAISYGTGYFQDALRHWKAAWELAKLGGDGVSKDIADLALAEYAKMNARIGRLPELEALITEAQRRNLMADARVKIESAAEGVWAMQHRPGISFRCGPYALLNVAQELKPDAMNKAVGFLEKVQSPPTGFSIPEVHAMSSELGLKLQIAKREAGAAVIIPAVVHWKVGHFGALTREVNGRLLLKDPTFNNETWMSQQASTESRAAIFLFRWGLSLRDGLGPQRWRQRSCTAKGIPPTSMMAAPVTTTTITVAAAEEVVEAVEAEAVEILEWRLIDFTRSRQACTSKTPP